MLRNFNMVCILSDVNKIDPNLTFRSSRTPSVCQYKHQSLVFFVFNSKWPPTFQFKMTDSFLIIATSKSSQNIHSMYFVTPNCLCMFFSIAFSLQQNANEHHRARFKSLKNTTNVVTKTICTELTNHNIYIV